MKGVPKGVRRGQSLVEFALVFPVVLAMLFGLIEFGRVIHAQVTVQNAAREGARFAITGQSLTGDPDDRAQSIVSVTRRALVGLPLAPLTSPDTPFEQPNDALPHYADVIVDPPDGGKATEPLTVTVRYNYKPVVSLSFDAFGNKVVLIPDVIQVEGTAVMVNEHIDRSQAPLCTTLYPIGVEKSAVSGRSNGEVFTVRTGYAPGNFGWLDWNGGGNSARELAQWFDQGGGADEYVNPADPSDRYLSVMDWVYGDPGVKNTSALRAALASFRDSGTPLTVVVWDQVKGAGNNAQYRVYGFARVQIVDFNLAQKWITFRFLDYYSFCYSPESLGEIAMTPVPVPGYDYTGDNSGGDQDGGDDEICKEREDDDHDDEDDDHDEYEDHEDDDHDEICEDDHDHEDEDCDEYEDHEDDDHDEICEDDHDHEAEVTPTPVPTPVSDALCSVLEVGFWTDDDEVYWNLYNAGPYAGVILRVQIDWPRSNGKLEEVEFGGETIWEGKDNSPPTDLSGNWMGDEGDRTLGVGQTKTLKFEFQKEVEDGYSITVWFDVDNDGVADCSVSR